MSHSRGAQPSRTDAALAVPCPPTGAVQIRQVVEGIGQVGRDVDDIGGVSGSVVSIAW